MLAGQSPSHQAYACGVMWWLQKMKDERILLVACCQGSRRSLTAYLILAERFWELSREHVQNTPSSLKKCELCRHRWVWCALTLLLSQGRPGHGAHFQPVTDRQHSFQQSKWGEGRRYPHNLSLFFLITFQNYWQCLFLPTKDYSNSNN